MKNRLIIIFLFVTSLAVSQSIEKDSLSNEKSKPERPAFESSALIDNQTNVVFQKGTLEFVMNHRFGLVNGSPKDNDLIGIWGPANIRLGINYSVLDWLAVGFGTTKDNRLQDFSLKGAILRQTRDDKVPVSVSFYGNFTIDARRKENFRHTEDRYSFFNQIIVARRFNRNLSFLISPSLSHYNIVENNMRNDMFAVGFGGRYKISPQTAIISEYTQPINTYQVGTPDPGVSLGVEFSTGSHAFQVFITNYKGIVPQQNIMFNQNNFFSGDFLIGFNITRLWNF